MRNMPRGASGEAAKLGDHYEGIWTVDSLLDLLSGEALSLEPEPLDQTEAEGIEFIKALPNGKVEYHSVKRQKPGMAWSLADLTHTGPRGRSILGDLFSKLARHDQGISVFVSQTGANELRELWERARASGDSADWIARLKEPKFLVEGFEQRVLPLCGQEPAMALERLRRMRVVIIDEQELLKRVEQKTAQWIYDPDGKEVDAGNVRRLLAELVINRLGQAILKSDLLNELQSHGLHLRVWAKEPSLLSRIADLNEGYLGPIRRQFINRQPIPRTEARLAFERLTSAGGQRAQLVVGAAGLGKTCVMAETVEKLNAAHVPVICLRLDNLPRISTTVKLGHELGLPGSPAIVLAGVANGAKCVLVIDQLDALSIVSGRNEHLWPVLHLLLAEADRIPNMRLLLACRAFDLQHDQRLRDLTGDGGLVKTVELSLLDVTHVHSAVRAAGPDPTRLTERQIELLRTPFNLQLYLEGEPLPHSTFRSVKDLFDRFWDRKAALVVPMLRAPEAWNWCITRLAESLSSGSSSAPSDILDEHIQDAKTMASHGVLVLENHRWRFFHEAFGDYAFARQFVCQGRDLVRFLVEEGEQHLYRRAQVREILAYERDRDRSAYMHTLRRLMADAKVRLHIKKLAVEWVSQLDDPGEDEWHLVESLLHEPALGAHALSVLWERPPWFDLLQRLGAWPGLLADERDDVGLRCAHMLGMEPMMRERSQAIASLFSPLLHDIQKWRRHFRLLFQLGMVHHSREVFDLALACLENGLFDDLDRRQDLLVSHLSQAAPTYAAEFIGKYLDRLCVLASRNGETNPFSDTGARRPIGASEIRLVAQKAPLVFAQQIAPRLQTLIRANALPPKRGRTGDKIWPFLTLGAEHDMNDALLFSTDRALRRLAAESPAAVEDLTRGWPEQPHHTIRFLLLRAWSGNGFVFANGAARYLIANPEALQISYDMMVGAEGNPTAAVSREILEAISPHCDKELHARLESVILAIGGTREREQARRNQFIELALLSCLRPERLTTESQARLKRLRAELPEDALSLPRITGVTSVKTSLPSGDFASLSDEEWLALFKKHNNGAGGWSCGGPPTMIYDVLGPLAASARANRKRFAALTARMSDELAPSYFDTILKAVGQCEDSAQGGKSAPPLGTEDLCGVIARLHALPSHPCGGAICSVVYDNKDREFPPEMLDVVGHYALNDPDPAPDHDERDGKELVNDAINTVRGSAADAIARLLFKKPDLAAGALPILERLAQDPSPCIRAVTIRPLLALLNRERDPAVRLFNQICASEDQRVDSDLSLDSAPVEKFEQLGQVRFDEVLRAPPGIGLFQAEIDRVGAVLDRRLGTSPIPRRRDQFRQPQAGRRGREALGLRTAAPRCGLALGHRIGLTAVHFD